MLDRLTFQRSLAKWAGFHVHIAGRLFARWLVRTSNSSSAYADNFLAFRFPTRTKVRNASFTDSDVGNTLAISGERTTTLLPSA
jgi:hypothetical protein